jgi:hypothetical protein
MEIVIEMKIVKHLNRILILYVHHQKDNKDQSN